jgi:CBS domain-containing protein
MLTEVPTAQVETPIDAVVHLVLSSPSRRVVVTNAAGIVQGIITDRRLLARAAASLQPRFWYVLEDLVDAVRLWGGTCGPLTAGDLMRTDVFTVRADEPIIHAIRLMMQRQVKRLVVVDDAGRLQGVVDRQTLLQWLAEASSRDWESSTRSPDRPAPQARNESDAFGTQ